MYGMASPKRNIIDNEYFSLTFKWGVCITGRISCQYDKCQTHREFSFHMSSGRITTQVRLGLLSSHHYLCFEYCFPDLRNKGSVELKVAVIVFCSKMRRWEKASLVFSNNHQIPLQNWGDLPFTEQLLWGQEPRSHCSVWLCRLTVNAKGMHHYPLLGQLFEAEEVKSLPSRMELEWSWYSKPVLFKVCAVFITYMA